MNRVSIFVLLIFLYSILNVSSATAQAEGRAVIRMQLSDSITGKPIQYATISIYPKGVAEPSRYGVSDRDGSVEIIKMEKGEFLIQIEHVGYYIILKYISTEKERVNDLGKIQLVERPLNINDVHISGETAIVEKGDTTEYNAKFFNPAPNDYLADLLKKMPGLSIIGNKIYFKGEEVKSLTVEGRPFFMSDNSIALENLPAYAVKKVALFRKKRDMLTGIEDAANAPYSINIILKDGMKSGLIGNLTPSYGTSSRYFVKGLLGRFGAKATTALIFSANNTSKDVGSNSTYNFNESGMQVQNLVTPSEENEGDIQTILTGVDYAKSKGSDLNLTYMNGTYRHTNRLLTTHNRKETFLKDATLISSSNDISTDRTDDINLIFRQNLVIPSNAIRKSHIYINFSPIISYTKGIIENRSSYSSTISGDDESKNYGELLNIDDVDNIKAGVSFSISKSKTKSNFRFSSIKTNILYNNDTKRKINNSITTFDNNISQIINQKKEDENDNLNAISTLTFVIPLELNLIYNFRYNRATSNIKTWEFDPQTEEYKFQTENNATNYTKSEILEHTIELKKTFAIKDVSSMNYWVLSGKIIPLCMRTVSNIYSDKYNKLNFVPFISYTSRKYIFKYYGDIKHPSLYLLQPIVNNSNPLYLFTGNPGLNPSYTHSLYFSHNPNKIKYGVNASLTTNEIIQEVVIDSQGITRATPANVNGEHSAKLFFDVYRIYLFEKIFFSTSLWSRYKRDMGYLNRELYKSNSFTSYGSITLAYKNTFFETFISGGTMYSNSKFSVTSIGNESTWTNFVSANINWGLPYEYTLLSKCNYMYYIGFKSDNKPSLVWDIELCKAILKKRLIVSLKAYDILNQTENLKVTYADNFIEERSVNMIRRYVMLSVSFKFGKF